MTDEIQNLIPLSQEDCLTLIEEFGDDLFLLVGRI